MHEIASNTLELDVTMYENKEESDWQESPLSIWMSFRLWVRSIAAGLHTPTDSSEVEAFVVFDSCGHNWTLTFTTIENSISREKQNLISREKKNTRNETLQHGEHLSCQLFGKDGSQWSFC